MRAAPLRAQGDANGKTATHPTLSSASFGMAWFGASTFRWTQTGDTLGALLSSA
jgi:hypothetical protein